MFGIVERVWACVCVSGWCPRFPSGRSEDVGTVCHEAKLLNICRMRTDSCCFYAPVVSLFGKIAIFADARALCQHPDTGGWKTAPYARTRVTGELHFLLSLCHFHRRRVSRGPWAEMPGASVVSHHLRGCSDTAVEFLRHRGRVFTVPW